jgi:hypothetical protein
MKNRKDERLEVRTDNEFMERVRLMANRAGIPLSEFVRGVLEEKLDVLESQQWDSRLMSADEAMRRLKLTLLALLKPDSELLVCTKLVPFAFPGRNVTGSPSGRRLIRDADLAVALRRRESDIPNFRVTLIKSPEEPGTIDDAFPGGGFIKKG